MSSKRRVRRKKCGNKTRHPDRDAALEHIFALVRSGKAGDKHALSVANVLMTPYRCSWCHFWHIGHTGRDE